ncbi:MAG: helix-turn-helix domain-containing protein [Planctomycetes bacterium]|nr:helix-turn-helix domain-containing protein [Planctomycetota bacterium]
MPSIAERYAERIVGTLSCFDRVVITGTLVDIGHARAMAAALTTRGVRLFDYTQFAEPLRDEVRAAAEGLAAESGLKIEYIQRKNFRKEERVRKILRQGPHQPAAPGERKTQAPQLVHIFSAMEPCASFRPWHDKVTHQTFLKSREAKCLHYYFYFLDRDLGLCYLRVPTWAPFRLQFYFNAHNWLACQLTRRGIAHTLLDNAFVQIDNWAAAQKIADAFDVKKLHGKLDRLARLFCPVVRHFQGGVHWSLMQVEYATDIVFRKRADLQPLYDGLVRTSIHAVKAENVATFLGRKLDGRFVGEIGNDFHTRIEGTRIRHHMGPAAIKMYDKHGCVLRIETTASKVDFFKHRRTVEHRDATSSKKIAPVRKTIYSLGVLAELLGAANRRYLEFLAALDQPDAGVREVTKVAEPVRDNDRSFRGFNLFRGGDLALFQAMVKAEFAISGLRNRDLQQRLGKSPAQISRLLKCLRLHGLIKKIGRTYKYYLTRLGQAVAACALRLRDTVVLPTLGMSASA